MGTKRTKRSRNTKKVPSCTSIAFVRFVNRGRLADGVLECLAGTEADDATLGNLDGGASLRVAGGARLALGCLERTEADEGDRIASLERSGDAVDERVNGSRGAGLGRACV